MSVSLAEVERLAKKQKLCVDCTRGGLDSLLQFLDGTLATLQEEGANVPDLLGKLTSDVKHTKLNKKISTATREFHEAIKLFGKVVESNFEADICSAARKEPLPRAALNQVIAEHLYREGYFDVGDKFITEASVSDGERSKEIFMDMHQIMKQMTEGNLQSALEWAASRRAQTPAGSAQPSHFEFKLHRLLYLDILKTKGVNAALAYARTHFDQFKHAHMKEIQQLMCCLVFASKPLEQTPYKHLISASALQDVVQDFVREACGVLGQAWESPLLVSVAAGSVALPQLLKLVKVMNIAAGSDILDVSSCDHMPIELELGPDFNFHSIFACPVSREQSDKGNPPCMLPCGHVLCSHSIDNIAKKQTHSFKCPYCPQETQPANCRVLHFPDVE